MLILRNSSSLNEFVKTEKLTVKYYSRCRYLVRVQKTTLVPILNDIIVVEDGLHTWERYDMSARHNENLLNALNFQGLAPWNLAIFKIDIKVKVFIFKGKEPDSYACIVISVRRKTAQLLTCV